MKDYELTNHLGNVLTTVKDWKVGITGTNPNYYEGYKAEISSSTDYLPFGQQMPSRSYQPGQYPYGMNGQRKTLDEITGQAATNYTATFWEYDARTGRRWNTDPKPNSWESWYSCFGGNPVLFSDILGDSSVFSNYGVKLHYDPFDKDLRVFMKDGSKLTQIGEIGKEININKIFSNILAENKKESYKMNPVNWYNKVKLNGDWDYKNNTSTIFGVVWKYDQNRSDIDKNANSTNFTYKNFGIKGVFTAADVGNYNAGWTGTHVGVPDYLQKVGAGAVEQMKNGVSVFRVTFWSNLVNDPYYGDKKADYYFNTKGMKDAHKDMSNDPKTLH